MNFNIYLRKDIGEKVTKSADIFNRGRNSISTWLKDFFNFEPVKSVPDFKKLRNELIQQGDRVAPSRLNAFF